MGYPPRLLSDGEKVVREFRPHWKAILGSVILGDLLLVAGVVIGVVTDQVLWGILGGVLAAIMVMGLPVIRWWFTRYVITNERIIVRSGVLARAGKEIPLEVINDVQFNQTVGERVFRSGDLLLESAGELGQSHFSDVPDPESVQTLIYRMREDRISALNTGVDATARLTNLANLHRDGVLTDSEFEEKKKKLLDEI
ncbi:MAG: PH domain-containing protein [Acidimicrobiia bacterium]|nr:PH domain-containing protein [Acidimicrobiia bacterium]